MISKKQTLRDYLRESFFKDDHLKRYEKRPIYCPLTSAKKSFVAWCSIHRWTDDTLPTLLADYLQPEAHRLAGELADLGAARATGDRAGQARAQARYDEVQDLHKELQDFLAQVAQIAERGAPPSDGKCPPRGRRQVRNELGRRRHDQQRRPLAPARARLQRPQEMVV